MIVVADTNVLVSGLLSARGAPARVLGLLTTGDVSAAWMTASPPSTGRR